MHIHSTTTHVTFYIYSTHFLTHTSITPPLLSLFFSFSFLFPTGRKIRHLFTKTFRVLNTYNLRILGIFYSFFSFFLFFFYILFHLIYLLIYLFLFIFH